MKSNRLMKDTLFCLLAVAMGGVVVTLFAGMEMPQGNASLEQVSSLVSQAASAGHHSGLIINR